MSVEGLVTRALAGLTIADAPVAALGPRVRIIVRHERLCTPGSPIGACPTRAVDACPVRVAVQSFPTDTLVAPALAVAGALVLAHA